MSNDSKPIFEFEPLFFLLNTNRNEMKSVAISECLPEGYRGVYFKEWNTGWSTGPTWVGKGCITNGQYDFTEDFETAIKHASNER